MKKWLVSTTLATLLAFLLITPTHALTPPSSITIYSAQIVKNTVENGDMSIVFHYNINGSANVSAGDAFMVRLYGTDGATLIASTEIFPFFNYGWGNGVASFYFDNATAPEWGLAYIINIQGSPAFFDPLPDTYNYTLDSTDYSAVPAQADNQALMAAYVISVCRLMEIAYPAFTLHGSTDTGTVLSAIGESYFRGAIPGIQSIAPSLFFTQFYVPDPTPISANTSQATKYAERLGGTDVMSGFDAIGTKVGTSGGFIAAMFCLAFAMAALILIKRQWGETKPGLFVAGIIMTGGAILLGDAVFIIRMIMALIGAILLFLPFLKRA